MNNIELAIVICNFNKKDYLRGCLDSLFASSLKHDSYTVIVVDNASTDGSVEMVLAEYSNKVILKSMSSNTGGSGGFHQGIEMAMSTNATYIALLDNDILLDKDTLVTLLHYLKENPQVGVAGAKICVMDKPNTLQELGSFIDWQNFNVSTPLKGHLDNGLLPEIVKCDYVPACCFITRREVVEKVGNFDRRHFIYWDDMDWCTRVKSAGYTIHALRDARVVHKMGAVNSNTTFSNYYFERNRIFYFIKHSDKQTFVNFTHSFVEQLRRQCFFANRKGVGNNVVSTLLGMMDIFSSQLYAQAQHVLEKQQVKPLDPLELENYSSLNLVTSDDVLTNQRVINMVLKNFGGRVYLLTDEQSYLEINEPRLTLVTKPEGEITIHITQHVLTAKVRSSNTGEYVVDGYLNQCRVDDIAQMRRDYDNYVSFFSTILSPVFERQLISAFEHYHANNAVAH